MLLLCRVVIVRDFYLRAHIWFSSKLSNSWAKSKDVVLNTFLLIPTTIPLDCDPRIFQTKMPSTVSFSSSLSSPVNKLALSCFLFSLAQATSGWRSYIAFVLGRCACLQHCVMSFFSSQAWNVLSCWSRWEWVLYCHLGQMKFLSILAPQSWGLEVMWIMNLKCI